MRTITLFLCLIMLALSSFAQDMDLIHKDMNMLIKTKQYKELLDFYLKSEVEYDAEMLFNIGYAYLNTGEYEKAIEYLSSSQEADPSKITPSFLIGMAYYSLGDNKKALQYMEPAIEKEWVIENDDDVEYYVHHAINVAQVYHDAGQTDKAWNLLNKAKGLLTEQSPYYSTVMLNIASFEMDKGNYGKAQPILEELIALNNENYRAIANMIQVYHHYDDFDSAAKLTAQMYRGNKMNVLPRVMRDIFCIDKFEYNGKKIQAFERFQQGRSPSIYDKHRFHIFDKDGKLQYTIKTEYVPREPDDYESRPEYFVLCGVTPDNKRTSYHIQLEEGYSYRELKEIALKLLDK